MVDIFNTTIDEKRIIGVGPLMTKRSSDQVIATLYNERAFYFQLYTTQYHFLITTDWLSFSAEHIEVSKLAIEAIKEAHRMVRECLITGCWTQYELHLSDLGIK